jgi:hypothetical protein
MRMPDEWVSISKIYHPSEASTLTTYQTSSVLRLSKFFTSRVDSGSTTCNREFGLIRLHQCLVIGRIAGKHLLSQ